MLSVTRRVLRSRFDADCSVQPPFTVDCQFCELLVFALCWHHPPDSDVAAGVTALLNCAHWHWIGC